MAEARGVARDQWGQGRGHEAGGLEPMSQHRHGVLGGRLCTASCELSREPTVQTHENHDLRGHTQRKCVEPQRVTIIAFVGGTLIRPWSMTLICTAGLSEAWCTEPVPPRALSAMASPGQAEQSAYGGGSSPGGFQATNHKEPAPPLGVSPRAVPWGARHHPRGRARHAGHMENDRPSALCSAFQTTPVSRHRRGIREDTCRRSHAREGTRGGCPCST